MHIPENGRKVAHVLLDSVSVSQEGDDESVVEATNLAYQRLVDEDLFEVEAEIDDDEVSITLDLSDILNGSHIPLRWALDQLAEARGVSVDDVIIELRSFIDS